MREASKPTKRRLSNAEFLAKLERIAKNWRYSDEFIGIVVRERYPRDFDDLLHSLDPVVREALEQEC